MVNYSFDIIKNYKIENVVAKRHFLEEKKRVCLSDRAPMKKNT